MITSMKACQCGTLTFNITIEFVVTVIVHGNVTCKKLI